MGQQQKNERRKHTNKEAPNLQRFRVSIVEMVNKEFGVQTMESTNTESEDEIRKTSVPKHLSRKISRKNARCLKKARRLAFSQHRKLPTSIEELMPESEEPKTKVENEKRLSGAQRRKKSKEKKKKSDELTKKCKEEEESRSRVRALHQGIAQDDKLIKQLSKQMKMNKRKRKTLPAAFGTDGLDYLLDAVDSEKLKALYRDDQSEDDENEGSCSLAKRHKVATEDSDHELDRDSLIDSENDDESNSEEEQMSHSSDSESEGGKEESNIEISSNDVSPDMGEDAFGDYIETKEIADSDAGSEVANEVEDISDNNDEKLREDIYGRLLDKHGKIITDKNKSGTYIPPAKRAAMLMSSEKEKVMLERLGKQVKGLLNKLSEANLASISSEMEALYRSNSRALMNQTLLENSEQTVLSLSSIPDRLLMVQAMIVTVLHANVDNEIGAFTLQAYVKKFHTILGMDDLAPTQKQLDNIVAFICYLYHFRVASSVLILDILKRLCDEFKEKHIEVIISVLRIVGFNLRKDDAAGLKEIILRLQGKASSVDLSIFTDQSRLKFMLDILLAIRNNNTRKLPQYDPDSANQARKIVSQIVKSGGDAGQLHISLNDLLASESHGAWWRIGSAWSGPAEVRNVSDQGDETIHQSDDDISRDLLELARKQRMNTDIRRKIFCTIMGSNDYLDCSEKLLRLGLNHRQEQEIIHVLIDCCLNEKSYNPYYSHLAEKLCRMHRRFTITCQYSVWDKLKGLADLSRASLNNLAKFVSHLLLESALPLSLFKVLNLAELDKPSMILTRKILLSILLKTDAKIIEIFSKVSQSTKYGTLAISLSAFMQHYVLKRFDQLKLECSQQVLQRKIALIERVLAGENRFGL